MLDLFWDKRSIIQGIGDGGSADGGLWITRGGSGIMLGLFSKRIPSAARSEPASWRQGENRARERHLPAENDCRRGQHIWPRAVHGRADHAHVQACSGGARGGV